MKDTNTIDGAGKPANVPTPRANKPATGKPVVPKGKTKQAKGGTGKAEVITPAASTALAAEFAVTFSATTEPWIVRTKSGGVRLVDKPVFAALILAKFTAYPIGEADKVKDKLKAARKSFAALAPEVKESKLATAQKLWAPMRKEYHATVNPLLKAASADKRFTQERFGVACTKGGIVHVASRLTYRPA